MGFFAKAHTLLREMGFGWHDTAEVGAICQEIGLVSSGHSHVGLLTRLERPGFLERKARDDMSPIMSAKWRITRSGKTFVHLFAEEADSDERTSRTSDFGATVVATVPPKFRGSFVSCHPEVATTWESLNSMANAARSRVRVLCPYLDQSIVALVQEPLVRSVDVCLITRPEESGDPTFQRLVDSGVRAKFMKEEYEGTQLYQVHAKALIVDSACAYVGSSNLTSTSLHYNFELGLMVFDEHLVEILIEVFDDLYHNYATEL
ncbi:MAG: phospholipase D-like domain-containing protein [Candidatus Thorarchaeota archaeon]